MSKPYYCFATQTEAQSCLDYINSTPWFPIVGKKLGVDDFTSQKTEMWEESTSELLTGEWAIPRIPDSRLDYVGVPQEDRNAFLVAFGQDIRWLEKSEFAQPPDEEI